MSFWDWLINLLNYFKSPPRKPINLKVKLNMTTNTATLTWTNPTTRTDGSPLLPADISHVEIFDSSPTGDTSFGFGTSPFITPVLNTGDHAFTVVVTDLAGKVSAPSNVATVTVLPADVAPAAVTDLTAVLNA